MEPAPDKQRFFRFMIAGAFVLMGFSLLQSWLFPPKPKAKGEEAQAAAVEKVTAVLGRVDESYPLLGLAAFPAQGKLLAAELLLPAPEQLAAQKDELRKLARKKAEEEAAVRKAAIKPAVPDRNLTMGGDGYKITAVFSEQHAAIRTITLNQFLTATRREARHVNSPLLLVGDEERPERLSFRLLVPGADIEWKLHPEHKPAADRLVYVAELPAKNLRITKTFTLRPDQYHVELNLEFERLDADSASEIVYQLTGPVSVPIEGEIWLQGRPSRQVVMAGVDPNRYNAVYRIVHQVRDLRGRLDQRIEKAKKAGQDHVEIAAADMELENHFDKDKKLLQYVGAGNQFFSSLIVINGDATQHTYVDRVETDYGDHFPPMVKQVPVDEVKKLHDAVAAHATRDFMGQVRLIALPVKPGNQPTRHSYLLYNGPSKVRLLRYEDGVQAGLSEFYADELHLSMLTDYSEYGWTRAIGWTWLLVTFTNLMHTLLEFFHGIGAPYWLAIILLTVLVRSCMFPISRKQALTSQRMQDLAPKLKELQAKYKEKEDRQAMAQAQWELYRKHKVNPFGGCLIVFLQMPIFMGLYYALSESVNLRLAPFLWIENLAAPDMLFWWGNWNQFVPFINVGPWFNLLPIVSITLMFIQQKLFMPPPVDEQAAMQQKMMNIMMFFFAYMFYWVASGLCLYFCISSGWGLLERKLLPKKKTATAAPSAPPPQSAARKPVAAKGPRGKPMENGESRTFVGRIKKWWQRLLEEAEKKR